MITCGSCDIALQETGYVFCVDGEQLCPPCARGMLEDIIEEGEPGQNTYAEALLALTKMEQP